MNKQPKVKKINMKEVKLKLNSDFKCLLNDYLEYVEKLNLASNSFYQREYIATLFLYYLQSKKILDINKILRENIINFLESFRNCSKFTKKDYLSTLKLFLKFLYSNAYTQKPLYVNLPKVIIPRQSKIPSVWNKTDIEKLLNCIDKDTAIGKRDYAILLLIIKLGLRKIDVINLDFNNINWSNKTINILQQKTKTLISLPLLEDIGWAIIDYIKNGRPKSDMPNIFLTHNKNSSSFSKTHGNFYYIITKYMKKAGIPINNNKKNGVHSLRHTLASEMLKQSTPIETISSVLGHVNSNVTSVYLKIDIEKLKECVLEVPIYEK